MKLKKGLLLLGLIIPLNINAASVGCTASQSNVSVGSTVNITFTSSPYASDVYWNGKINYDSSKLRLVSGANSPWIEGQQKANYTFKAIASGSAYVKVSDLTMSVGDQTALENSSSSSCTINISSSSSTSTSQNNDNSNKSSNNKLASLKVEGASLAPEFSKDKLSYSATVKNSVTSVTISATKEDQNSSISGTGTKELIEGANKFNIVVTAENGSSRTYSIIITREEEEPIKVKVNKKEYTVVTKIDEEFKIPDGFEKSTTDIDGKEVLAFKNEDETVTLVLLRAEEDDNPKFFVYDENKLSFIPFNLITNKALTLIALDVPKEIKGYKTKQISIDDIKVKGLVSESNKEFILIYALNVDTGKKDYYIYNKESNSLILYDKDIYQPYQKVKNDEKLSLMAALKKSGGLVYFVSLAGTAFIFLITTIALLAKNRKLKKAYAIAGPANYDNDFEEGDTLTEIDQEELNKRYDEFLEKNVPEEDEDEKTIKELFSEKDSTDNYDELSKIIDEDLTITQIRKNKLKKKKKD